MAKVMRCRDVGMDCDFVARAETEQEILQQAEEHAREDHGMDVVPEEVVERIREAIHEEE